MPQPFVPSPFDLEQFRFTAEALTADDVQDVSERLAAGGRTVVLDLGAAKVRDVSMQGIGLLLGRRVEPGTLLTVVLWKPEAGSPLAHAGKPFVQSKT